MLHHHMIFGEGVQNGKEMVRTGEEHGKIECRHCSTLAESALLMGDKKWRHTTLTLDSIYGMGDVPAFMIKGYVSLAKRISFTCIIGEVQ
jgi:hypothetical protein